MFIKPLDSGDKRDKPIVQNAEQRVIFAFNPDTHELVYHGPLRVSALPIAFYSTSSVSIFGFVDWGVAIAIAVFSLLGALVSLAIMITVAVRPRYFHYQETLFCQLILFGTLVGYASSLVNIAPSSTRATCLSNLWLLNLSYVFVVSCLFIKAWRMWRLLEISAPHLLKITRLHMLRIVAAHMIIEVIVLIFWTIVDPPIPLTFNVGDAVNLGCVQTNDTWWFVSMGSKFVYLGFGAFLSVKNRKHAPLFGDSKEVGISVYVLFFTMCILGVIGITLRNIPFVVFIVKSFGVTIPYMIVTIGPPQETIFHAVTDSLSLCSPVHIPVDVSAEGSRASHDYPDESTAGSRESALRFYPH